MSAAMLIDEVLATAPAHAVVPLVQRYHAVRQHSLGLVTPLSPEDCCAQSMPDASPAKWHLAHTTWFFETFVLERWEPDFAPFHPGFRMLFNSYYDSVGERHPRPARGLLTRPSLAEVLIYRQQVDARMGTLLQHLHANPEVQALVTLGLQHEQQHQELMLTDLKHLLFANPLRPAYVARPAPVDAAEVAGASRAARPLRFQQFAGGLVEIGHARQALDDEATAFAFDNESPRHKVYLAPYAIADRLVSNGEYRAFVEDGGYDDPLLWLSEGWAWRQAAQHRHPLYWEPGAPGAWLAFTLGGLQPLRDAEPVAHLSYFEADAFARWAGARLPTEAEWEHAAGAAWAEAGPGLRGPDQLHPQHAAEAQAQWFGELWQWTQSSYAAYPGFRPAPGAVGEYNGKFMVNQYVLRGSSCATPAGHARPSYRNFFPATACWQFSGLRLAKDLSELPPGG